MYLAKAVANSVSHAANRLGFQKLIECDKVGIFKYRG